MYYVYMNCVTMSLAGIDVQAMWDDVVKSKIVKKPEDLFAFMGEIKTLTDPSAGEWWKQVKELMEAQGSLTAEHATERQRIDGLVAGVKDLQISVAQLLQNQATMMARLEALERSQQEQIARSGTASVVIQEQIQELTERAETVEAAVEQVQEIIEDRVVAAVTEDIAEATEEVVKP